MPTVVRARPWIDLTQSSGWPLLLRAIQEHQRQLVDELRLAIRKSDFNLSARKEGGLEELERLLVVVNEGLKQDAAPESDGKRNPARPRF